MSIDPKLKEAAERYTTDVTEDSFIGTLKNSPDPTDEFNLKKALLSRSKNEEEEKDNMTTLTRMMARLAVNNVNLGANPTFVQAAAVLEGWINRKPP